VDKFGQDLLVIQLGFLVILSTMFLWLWFSNRRKYHNYKHVIPATVVKSYLDSIIQNSTALKSSLFRGGGIEANGVPSVIPLSNLLGGESIGLNGTSSTSQLEENNQKNALISSLQAQLSSSQASVRELESKLGTLPKQLEAAEKRIKELEALLANPAGGGDAVLKSQLTSVTKERDDYRDRLKEFEIIADDLANLKRLQQENEQLKRSLAASGGSAGVEAAVPNFEASPKNSLVDLNDIFDDVPKKAEEPVFESGPAQTVEEPQEPSYTAPDATSELADCLSAPTNTPEAAAESIPDDSELDMAAAMAMDEQEANKKDDIKVEKTSEDLLSEFEKMLG